MSNRTCTFEGCASKHYSLGYCRLHYGRHKAGREMGGPRKVKFHDAAEALRTRVKRAGECIEWDGARIAAGYGVLRVDGKLKYTHRLVWERDRGPIPDGMFIDHMCFNRACMNVEHLRLATPMQNSQNRSGAKPGSTSKYRGVSWYEPSKRWKVQVKVGGKNYQKYFLDESDAARYAAELRREHMTHSQN